MKHREMPRRAVVTTRVVAAGVLAAALPVTLASAPAGAAPTPVDATAVAGSLAPVTKRVDVDGDRRLDRVTLTHRGGIRYLLTVVPARGRTVTVPVWSSLQRDWGTNPLLDVGGIDGARGAEIVLGVSGGDGVSMAVLTWRGGKLVNLAAPMSRGSLGVSRNWYSLGEEWGSAGYRFWTAGGQRKAAAGQFERNDSGRWTGVITTSLWTAKGWNEVASQRLVVSEAVARAYAGINGIAR